MEPSKVRQPELDMGRRHTGPIRGEICYGSGGRCGDAKVGTGGEEANIERRIEKSVVFVLIKKKPHGRFLLSLSALKRRSG